MINECLDESPNACSMDGMYAINLSQPHLNDMEAIYRNTVDKGIKLLGSNGAMGTDYLRQWGRLGSWYCTSFAHEKVSLPLDERKGRVAGS